MPLQRSNTLLFSLLGLALIVYFLNDIAQDNFYYWTFWWYDIMMHFLGGVLISGIALWTYGRLGTTLSTHPYDIVRFAIITVILVGVGWEVFEYFGGMYTAQSNIVADTLGDLVMDIIGSIVGWGIVYSFFRQRTFR